MASAAMETDDWTGRWTQLNRPLSRPGPLATPAFTPGDAAMKFIRDTCRLLIVGAGGLGCELLKDVALSGFRHIHVIDMDTIDLSNLNRQFLFRRKDVGQPKAQVAAEFIRARVPGVVLDWTNADLTKQPVEFYKQFNMIICGLDSIEARRWINSTVIDLVEFDDDGNVDGNTIIPIIDGGTEGFKGQARVIIPKMSACFECTLDLFPPRVTFPMCTIAHTPRLPEHCIEWASSIAWPATFTDKKIDTDDPEHLQWLFRTALERALQYNIQGVTYRLTQGVVKNIIPAIASTNAIIAAACANEALKLATQMAAPLQNYMMYTGGAGVYSYTFEYERKEACPACGSNLLRLSMPASATLEQLVERLMSESTVQIKRPSLSGGGKSLYMQAPPSLEAKTRANLSKPLHELLATGDRIRVTDPGLPFFINVELTLEAA